MLLKTVTEYCDSNFKSCGNCGKNCTHPSGRCYGNCADCLHEMQYHRNGGRTE
jgi:hypothetical protein